MERVQGYQTSMLMDRKREPDPGMCAECNGTLLYSFLFSKEGDRVCYGCYDGAPLDELERPPKTEFERVLDEVLEMHRRKNRDYGSDEDPYANVSDSAQWGVRPWVGASIRLSDKERRLKLAASGGTLANEGIEDSMIDNVVYNVIRLILWRRENKK